MPTKVHPGGNVRNGSKADLSDYCLFWVEGGHSATGKIYYDADGNGGGAQVLFAQVTAGTALTNADFLVGG